MKIKDVQLEESQIAAFCRKHGVDRLSLFGSALRDDFGGNSDIDLLVVFDPRRRVSLFDLGGMTMELRDMIGRDVDLRTAEDLSRYFREEVVRTAKLIYAA